MEGRGIGVLGIEVGGMERRSLGVRSVAER